MLKVPPDTGASPSTPMYRSSRDLPQTSNVTLILAPSGRSVFPDIETCVPSLATSAISRLEYGPLFSVGEGSESATGAPVAVGDAAMSSAQTKNERRLAKLADRLTIVLMYIDSQSKATSIDLGLRPFNQESFWTSDEANEMREMPLYNEVKDKVREMVQ